jgi:dihydrofolate reductase
MRLIYARSLNNVIGLDNKLPWRIPGDLTRFKQLTNGGIVVMGRKTWDSLPKKPLDGRINIVLSSQSRNHFGHANVHLAGSPGRVMEIVHQYGSITPYQEAAVPWLIGGVSVYEAFAGLVTEVYETVVMSNDVKGDTYYKFEGRTQLMREDERMSCSINGKLVDVVNRVLRVIR